MSAFQCLKSFDEYLYNIYCVYIDQKGVWRYFKDKTLKEFMEQRNNFSVCQLGVNENVFYILKGGKYKKLITVDTVDVVVPIMHGINGEDGCISGLLNMCNIPYVGSDNISSAIGIDKYLFKKMCDHLPILPYEVCGFEDIVDDADFVNNISKKVGFPCIVKPCRQGSSIGVNICKNEENLINSIKNSLNFDKKVILEKFVGDMREFNIAVLLSGGELIVSEIEEPISGQNILTFEDKYLN